MTTLESWRIIVENEHNDIQKMLDDWENEQQAALLTRRELSNKIADLVDMLRQAWVAIGTLDEDCLGYGTAAFGSKRWPLRNELLRDIEQAFTKASVQQCPDCDGDLQTEDK